MYDMVDDTVNLLIRAAQEDENQDFLFLALESIFEGLMDRTESEELEELEKVLGEEEFSIAYVCALEFLASNLYSQGEEGEEESDWNLIDEMLAGKNDFSKEQKDYLLALRNSVMSLYQVETPSQDDSVILKDVLRGGTVAVVDATGQWAALPKGQFVAARIVPFNGKHVATPGMFGLSAETAGKAKLSIESISQLVVEAMKADPELNMSEDEIRHYVEVLWVRELTTAWFSELTGINFEEESEFNLGETFNADGHEFTFVGLNYPLTATEQAVRDALHAFENIVALPVMSETGSPVYGLLKLCPGLEQEKTAPAQTVEEFSPEDEGVAHCDTMWRVPNREGIFISEFICELEEGELKVICNSEERASIAHQWVEKHLTGKVGAPDRISKTAEEMFGDILEQIGQLSEQKAS